MKEGVTLDIITSIQEFLTNNVPKMVIKYNRDAKKNETLESRRAADIYISVRQGTDSWVTFKYFEKEVIRNAAKRIPLELSDNDVDIYWRDKNRIPVKYRSYFIKAQEDWILANYEEKNEYYRMLHGLPPIDAEDLYLDDSIYEYYEIEKTPIHKIQHNALIAIEDDGILEPLKKQYPSYKFLEYLGARRIDILEARRADNYDILYFPQKIENFSYKKSFLQCYDQAKEYILTLVYNIYYSSKYEFYDNYLAFIVLVMAIQRLINEVIKIVVSRDFYDTHSIKLFLTAYGIPYSNSFSIYQNRLLVKNLNILLSKKSNSRILIDIMDLLGFDDFELIKYYMVKHHKIGNDGKPLFKYLTDELGNFVYDENGEKILDAESVYEFYFNGIPINASDIQQELNYSNNILTYDEMTRDDNLWVDDDTTKKKLMESEFNYAQTKYVDVNAVFKLQEILFETVYATRLVLDKGNRTKQIMVSMNQISDSSVSLFDCFVLLICLLCKYNGMEPDLLTTPSQILYINGFNFEADLDAIREDIRNNRIRKSNGKDFITVDNLYDSRLAKYILDTNFRTPRDVNNMYKNVKELHDLLTECMNNADTLVSYDAYRKLYNTLMYTKLNNSIYNLSDGSTPKQFSDYLLESNYKLYNIYKSDTQEQASQHILYITQRLSSLLTDTKYFTDIQLLSLDDIESILRLLRFFESYTVDIRSSKIILFLNSRLDNMAHFIDNAKKFNADETMEEYNEIVDFFRNVPEYIKMNGSIKIDQLVRKLFTVQFLLVNCEFDEDVKAYYKESIDNTLTLLDYAKSVISDIVIQNSVEITPALIVSIVVELMKLQIKSHDESVFNLVCTNISRITHTSMVYVSNLLKFTSDRLVIKESICLDTIALTKDPSSFNDSASELECLILDSDNVSSTSSIHNSMVTNNYSDEMTVRDTIQFIWE